MQAGQACLQRPREGQGGIGARPDRCARRLRVRTLKIFCFDLMLFCQTADRLGGPGFIIHDSPLIDGVDKRQARLALLLGREAAIEKGGQYIVLMNSDEFRKIDEPADLQLEDAVLSVRLTDDEGGELFGFRYDLPGGT